MNQTIKSTILIDDINCLSCGKPLKVFPSQAQRKKYCSRACQWRGHEKVQKKCELCGKQFMAGLSIKERSRFCSRVCSNTFLARQQEKTILSTVVCNVCDNVFQPDHSGKKYCSKECANAARAKASSDRARKIKKPCKECGKVFEVFPSRFDNKLYCSSACGNKGRSKLRKGRTLSSTYIDCAFCKNPVRRHKCRLSNNERAFCDSDCFHKWDKEYKNTEPMIDFAKQRAVTMLTDGTFASPSKIEGKVSRWLDEIGCWYQSQFKLGPYFVADFKVGDFVIEVNGCYWHGCPLHNDSTNEMQRKRIARDKRLESYCLNHDLKLLIIWEHEINEGDFSSLSPLT